MNLSPTERERLLIFSAAELARRYRSKGIRLSHPEAVAFICDEVMTAARQGLDQPALVELGGSLLTARDVEPGVASLIPFISVEVNMAEGTKLVTIFDPIAGGEEAGDDIVPGEIFAASGDIEVNAGREVTELEVVNRGDRTIQVRSHAHFFETNRALEFDRARAYGMRLDTPSGVGVKFEPGVKKAVRLVGFGGERRVHGFANLVDGPLDDASVRRDAVERAAERGYGGNG